MGDICGVTQKQGGRDSVWGWLGRRVQAWATCQLASPLSAAPPSSQFLQSCSCLQQVCSTCVKLQFLRPSNSLPGSPFLRSERACVSEYSQSLTASPWFCRFRLFPCFQVLRWLRNCYQIVGRKELALFMKCWCFYAVQRSFWQVFLVVLVVSAPSDLCPQHFISELCQSIILRNLHCSFCWALHLEHPRDALRGQILCWDFCIILCLLPLSSLNQACTHLNQQMLQVPFTPIWVKFLIDSWWEVKEKEVGIAK